MVNMSESRGRQRPVLPSVVIGLGAVLIIVGLVMFIMGLGGTLNISFKFFIFTITTTSAAIAIMVLGALLALVPLRAAINVDKQLARRGQPPTYVRDNIRGDDS
jgi:hypothetical protein